MRTRFGEYFIQQKVAIGGMAEIYRASTTAGQPVAIKMVLPQYASQAKFVQMFIDEARIVVGLQHANIVRLLDFGKVGNTYFFSMEWIDGKALSDIVTRQTEIGLPFPPEVAIYSLLDVLRGLGYAHQRRDRFDRPLHIVHRDISPSNILLTRSGVAKIADFGIAHARDKSIETQPGIIRGKYSYMSPEQTYGGEFDNRSDLFSAGVVLFELLTSSRLFLRDNDLATIEAVRACRFPEERLVAMGIPERLVRVVRKALQSNSKKRYSTAEEFTDDLKNVLRSEYSTMTRQRVAEFLTVLFPNESFIGVSEPPAQLRQAFDARQAVYLARAARIPYKHLLDRLERARYPVSLMLGLATLGLAELIQHILS